MAQFFWVGGSGTWNASTTVHWDTTSGGAGNKGLVPGSGDTAVFDGNSGVVTVTVANLSAVCRSLICNGSVGSGAFAGHLIGGNNLEIRGSGTGSILLSSAMTVSLSLTFAGVGMTGVTTITSAGKSFGSMGINMPGTVLFGDPNRFTSAISFAQGTLDTGGWTFTWNSMIGSGGAVRNLKLRNSHGTCGRWNQGNANFTVATSATSILTLTYTGASAQTLRGTFGTVVIMPGGTGAVQISGSYEDIRCTGNKQVVMIGNWTIRNPTGSKHFNGADFGYLALPGVTGNYVSTPSSTALRIAGDIDIRWRGVPTSWSSGTSMFINKLLATNTMGYRFFLSGGALVLDIATTVLTQMSSSAVVPFSTGTLGWVRATYSSSTLAIKFYTSLNGITWTMLGSTRTATVSSIGVSTTALLIGAATGGGTAMSGNLYRAQVYSGITGTLVFDADFTKKPVTKNTFQESSSNHAVVTIVGASAQLGDGRLMLTSSTPGTAHTIVQTHGEASHRFLSVQDSHVTGGAHYRAFNSMKVSNTTGWHFAPQRGPSGGMDGVLL